MDIKRRKRRNEKRELSTRRLKVKPDNPNIIPSQIFYHTLVNKLNVPKDMANNYMNNIHSIPELPRMNMNVLAHVYVYMVNSNIINNEGKVNLNFITQNSFNSPEINKSVYDITVSYRKKNEFKQQGKKPNLNLSESRQSELTINFKIEYLQYIMIIAKFKSEPIYGEDDEYDDDLTYDTDSSAYSDSETEDYYDGGEDFDLM